MPSKLGKGGQGPEDFDPDTGEYTAGSTISKRGNDYQVHGELRSRKITKDEYDLYKSKGYKEDFDTTRNYDIKEAERILNDKTLRLSRSFHLGHLVDQDKEMTYSDRVRIGKGIYNEIAEEKGKQFINSQAIKVVTNLRLVNIIKQVPD